MDQLDQKKYHGGKPNINFRTGMKYSIFGTGRTGMASIQDSAYIEHKAKQIQSNLGSGVQRFAAVDENGDFITNATRNHNGRIHQSKKGIFTQVDTDVLDYEYQREQEVEQAVDHVMKYCIVTDLMTQRVLNFPEPYYTTVFDSRPDGIPGNEFMSPVKMPTSISVFDCRASYLKLLPSDSKELSGGLAKLRMIVSYNMPILEGSTPNRVIRRTNALDEAPDRTDIHGLG